MLGLEDLGVDAAFARAFHAACARYSRRPYVTAVDVGPRVRRGKRESETCLRIHVREKVQRRLLVQREALPQKLLGCPVDVIQGRYVSHVASAGAAQAASPVLRPGISISNTGGRGGTLGVLARSNQDGQPWLVSAGHVLAPHDQMSPDEIVQPAAHEDSRAEVVGHLRRLNIATDSAGAEIATERELLSAQARSGVVVSGIRYPKLHDVLEKSGVATGRTWGEVTGFGRYGDGNIDGLALAFLITPLRGAGGLLADFGDSGAVWYATDHGRDTDRTEQAVGLHCKGNPDRNPHAQYAVATLMVEVCKLLNVTV